MGFCGLLRSFVFIILLMFLLLLFGSLAIGNIVIFCYLAIDY